MQHSLTSKIVATTLLILLGVLLIIALYPYLNAFLGAFILYVLFIPLHKWLVKKKIGKRKAAWIVMILTLLVILLPLMLLIPAVISQVSDALSHQDVIIKSISDFDEQLPQYNLREIVRDGITDAVSYIRSQLGSLLGGLTDLIITFVIMYFVLYYLFVHPKKWHGFKELLPFSAKNTNKLTKEFSQVSKATIYTTGIIALFQGTLLGIGLAIAGVPGSLFWGFVGVVLSFIPIVGIPIIWIPAGIFLILSGNWIAGVAILIWGAILSNVDNFIRPYLQEKIGKIHPLTSLVGIFIGLPLFGILGIIIGPLLISYFFLILNMYLEEYGAGSTPKK